MLRLLSKRWGTIGLLPDLDESGQVVSEDRILNNERMAIRIREWSWPSCQAVMGTFRFPANDRIVFSGLDASCVLLILLKNSLQIQFSGIRREMHDRGAYLLFSSGRSITVQFFADRDYQLNLIFYPAAMAGSLLPNDDRLRRLQTQTAAWYYPRALICTAAMLQALARMAEEPAGPATDDGRPVQLCRDILRDYLSPGAARFQSSHLVATQLDDFYAACDRLLSVVDRVASFSKLMSAAGIRDRPLFRKRMNQVYGLNIRDFITRSRMEKAAGLLADFSLSIKQIASMTGFKNAFYFSRVFSRYFGQSPKSYRSHKI